MATYQKYLERIYPGSSWIVDPISAGYINKTIRVTKTSGEAQADSFILKHARSTFGEKGRERKFSLKRQGIERTILELWDSDKPLHDSAKELPWLLPKCLRQDQGVESDLGLTESSDEASVLLIEDLGPLLDIDTCLEQWAKTEPSSELVSQVTQIGRYIGASLAHLHSRESVSKISRSPEISEILSQSLTNELVWHVMINPLPKYLKPLPDAEELCRRVTEDIKTPPAELSNVLCHGDFHNGNVLLPTALPKPGESVRPIVVDWEFGHLLGRGVNGDAAEFTAGIHCHLITARRENPPYATLLRALLRGFCFAYRDTAQLFYRSDGKSSDVHLLRSALLFHATEMISCAYEYTAESKTFEEMFGIGVWYLRLAGKDVEEFATKENLAKLAEEDESVITSLFNICL